MKEKIGFFEEDVNVKSSTRLNSFLLLLFLVGFDLMWVYAGNGIDGNFLIFNGLLLVGVFTPKYLHKIVEAKTGIIHQNETKEVK